MEDAACMGNNLWENRSLKSFLTSETTIQGHSIEPNKRTEPVGPY